MLDWLIIGGGLHGTHLAAVLRKGGSGDIGLLDPHPEPLARWRACTEAVGMRFLRSPGVHHLDVDPFSLLQFARAQGREDFAPPYQRPSVELFAEHCAFVEASYGLGALRQRGRALRLKSAPNGAYEVETSHGQTQQARRVVLAMGMGDQPHVPAFALVLGAFGVKVRHVYEPGFVRPRPEEGPVMVVGGGISAAQLAMRLAEDGVPVLLWMRHPPRVHQFDSDPGWIGPRYMAGFLAEPDMARRRAQITAARHRGSLPPDVDEALGQAVRSGAVQLITGELRNARPAPSGGFFLDTAAGTHWARQLLLCSGFEGRRPGGSFVEEAIARFDLRCADCGFPIPDAQLQWRPGLFVMGPLAELVVGPTARNITGARAAAARISAAA